MCIDCGLDLGWDLKQVEVIECGIFWVDLGAGSGYRGIGERAFCLALIFGMNRVATLFPSLCPAKRVGRNLISIRKQPSSS